MKHVYSVIRYVPDPFRGEYINVGAIVGCEESSEWGVRQVENPLRARQLGERESLSAVWDFIDQVGRELDAYEQMIQGSSTAEPPTSPSETWLTELYHRCTNVVQLSPPLPLRADSVDDALDHVFGELIVDPAKRPGGVTKHPALAAVRRAYADAGVSASVHQGVMLAAGRHHERLDFVVANGHVVQITQAWSFRVADQDAVARYVRAWGWAVLAAQTVGGVLKVDDATLDLAPHVDVEAVFIPPLEGSDIAAFLDASDVFASINAHAVPITDARLVGQRATALLAAR